MAPMSFPSLPELAQQLRTELAQKKFVLLYAYNGTGKTRLSVAFKDLGKKRVLLGSLLTEASEPIETEDGDTIELEDIQGDTLYFNAFTEDLFHWDNDLKNDRERVLKINKDSRFFAGLGELEMDNRIRPLLNRYADFDFRIDTTEWEVSFSREVEIEGAKTVAEDIKVSRGEENIFIWCFFLAIVELAMDPEIEAYRWVKYVYIDDPISSLDEHNAIGVANHLAQLLLNAKNPPKTVVSSHHTLFFNVLGNEFGRKANRHFLSKGAGESYLLRDTGNTPFFHHVASLRELCDAAESGELRTHHFNMLRAIMEKTASFHGYGSFYDCIRPDEADGPDKTMYARVVNIMSHGNYSLYEPVPMMEENQALFRKLLSDFRKHFQFNPILFDDPSNEAPAA
ncbi:anticodon nuclease [Aromatoleum aromaticum EbN1]|uniref:Anticodon nuclease n=1 Tax=Aromatoleum aromaticum (strain DSM 19018 / LMG 30748 / EbN1) TaxID=76114 RepID=Q5P522_AROAE|nr:AAA family ATPase [Aromatoleum aromaticum]CAI07590.1 anticodon nuclease [Aromatoleum aromaticum EbN1]